MDNILFLIDSSLYNSTGYLFVALGILVSIRFMGFPDLTADGSFTLGAAVYAVCIKNGLPVFVCFLAAYFGGLIAGFMTTCINRGLKIGKIISSVLVMMFLITVVPYITGGSTIGLISVSHLFSELQQLDIALTRYVIGNPGFSLHILFTSVLLIICLAGILLIKYFFRTRIGIEMRYIGSSKQPSLISKRKNDLLLLLGLTTGNALIGIGGAIEAERHGGFSQNMGLGILLIGLSCLVLGESIIKSRLKRDYLTVSESLIAVIVGVLSYSFILQSLLAAGLTFLDVRLTTTLFLLVMLTFASKKHPNSGRLF